MNAKNERCVIVGSGHSAAQLCVSLTQADWAGQITLIGDEAHAPYHRPPLSKSYLNPDKPEALQLIRPKSFYTDHSIELLLGQRAESIDTEERVVVLADRSISYDNLVLATGSTHRRPPISGIDHPNVLTLQNAQQADSLRERVSPKATVVIIGAGFIGLEVASSLRKLHAQVVVLERVDRVLSRVTSPQVSSYFEAMHRRHGVDLHTGVSVTAIDEVDGKMAVYTEDDRMFSADFVVVGAGATPNDQLAADAGLVVDNGIVVDEYNRTSDAHIYAMGDCCNQFRSQFNRRMRLESVQNAVDQAKTVAAAIIGQPKPHDALPWFWSDQYDVKFQTAGISTGYDQCLIRGSMEQGEHFSAWYLKDDRLIAVDAVNDSRAYAVAGKLIPIGQCPSPELIVDPNVTPKQLLLSAKEAMHA